MWVGGDFCPCHIMVCHKGQRGNQLTLLSHVQFFCEDGVNGFIHGRASVRSLAFGLFP